MENKKVEIYGILGTIVIIAVLSLTMLRAFFFPLKYKNEVLKYAEKYNLDPYLVLAIINTESGFDDKATSSREAKGLMQLRPTTAQEINEETNSTEEINDETIYEPAVNIEIGCKYIAGLVDRYDGNYYLAICAYNAGIGNVNKWIETGVVSKELNTDKVDLPFRETSMYLSKVIDNYDSYKKLYKVLAK